MMLSTKRRLMIVLKWRIQNSWRLESAELRKFFFFLISQTTWKTQLVNCNRTMLATTEHSVELVFIFQDMFATGGGANCSNPLLGQGFLWVLLCDVQLVLELLFGNFHCSYLCRSTCRCGLTQSFMQPLNDLDTREIKLWPNLFFPTWVLLSFERSTAKQSDVKWRLAAERQSKWCSIRKWISEEL